MENSKIQYFEQATTDRQVDFIQVQNHCALCGSVLILEHNITADRREIIENAHCPECQIRNRSRQFPIQ